MKKCIRPDLSLMASIYRCTQLSEKYMKPTPSPLRLQSKQFMKLPVSPDEKFPATPPSSQCEPGNGRLVGPASAFQIPSQARPVRAKVRQNLGQAHKSYLNMAGAGGLKHGYRHFLGVEHILPEFPQSGGKHLLSILQGSPIPSLVLLYKGLCLSLAKIAAE